VVAVSSRRKLIDEALAKLCILSHRSRRAPMTVGAGADGEEAGAASRTNGITIS